VNFLVDANVLCEPTRPEPDRGVVEWLRAHEREIAIAPIILGEIRFGILLLPSGNRRRQLESWLDEGVKRIHCLPWDAASGLRWSRLLADLRAKGRSLPVKDSMIAASALVHDLTIVTRNVRDFQSAGVRVENPFA
jgi:predicted nucleic acid-binding protein